MVIGIVSGYSPGPATFTVSSTMSSTTPSPGSNCKAQQPPGKMPPPRYSAQPPAPHISTGPPPPGYYDPSEPPQRDQRNVYPPPRGSGPVLQHQPRPVAPPHSTAQVHQSQRGYGDEQFGHTHVEFLCPHCNNRVRSILDYRAGETAWLIAALLFIIGLHLCAIIPLLIKDYKDVEHYCPVCKNLVAVYKRKLF